MDAVYVDSRRKNIRVSAKSQRCQVASQGCSPYTDAPGIHIRSALQVFSRSKNIAIFRGATCSRVLRKLERLAVPNAQSVIDRQYDEAPARQILICAVVVRVLPPIVPTQHHLSRSATVNIDDCRFPCFSTD